MATTNLTGSETQTGTFQVLACSPTLTGGIHEQLFSAVNIFLSVTVFLGNALILVALIIWNLPFICRPNSCIAVWQQLISALVLLSIISLLLIECPWFTKTGVFVDTHTAHVS